LVLSVYLSINLKIPSISIHTLIHSDAFIDLNQPTLPNNRALIRLLPASLAQLS